ncbi:MAG: zinc ribbon domain-containing protein [Planctomycetota bacterium]|nr:zinc ribbon domain-containing protein [Planctomycetota bacterium]
MPTYDYECDACGHAFEQFQSIKASPVRKCPACGKRKVRRLIGTGAGVIFKGSGFYQTDYRSDSYKKSAQGEKPAAAATADKAGKTDAPAKADKSSDSK